MVWSERETCLKNEVAGKILGNHLPASKNSRYNDGELEELETLKNRKRKAWWPTGTMERAKTGEASRGQGFQPCRWGVSLT